MLSVTFGTHYIVLKQCQPVREKSHFTYLLPYMLVWTVPATTAVVEAGHELKASMLQVVGITASLIRIKKKKEEASTTNDYFTTVIE